MATDDVIGFQRAADCVRDAGLVSVLDPLDDVWDDVGIVESRNKRVHLSRSGVALGVHLQGGVRLLPRRDRLVCMVEALLHLIERRRCSPCELNYFMGHWHWMLLLNRPILACLREVYAVTRDYADTGERLLSNALQSELAHLAALVPFLTQDLRREWDNRLLASDGAPSYGFGVSQASCHPDVLREVAAHAAVPLSQIRLTVVEGDEEPPITEEPVLHLGLTLDDFTPIISSASKRKSHAATTEVIAATLAVRRLAQRRRSHSRRAALLVDSRALLFALRKGRSSAPCFCHHMKVISSLLLAADIKLTAAYIPSCQNPAGWPSRGKYRVRRAGRPPASKVPLGSKTVRRLDRAMQRLRHEEKFFRRLRRDEGSACSSPYATDDSGSCDGQPDWVSE